MIEARFQGRLGGFTLDVSLSTPASGVTVLFGPSGSGKTTLLRCLAGLTRLQGRLSVDGRDLAGRRRRSCRRTAGGSATCFRTPPCSNT